MADKQINKLRELAVKISTGDLQQPWHVQTSNSFRRIGTDRGDGNVLCAVNQHPDGHPDLHAAPGVLDYIVAAHPAVMLELIEQRDRAWHAIDHLRHIILNGYAAAFTEVDAMRGGREA